eukprot:3935337-Rhodomonas_salina.2
MRPDLRYWLRGWCGGAAAVCGNGMAYGVGMREPCAVLTWRMVRGCGTDMAYGAGVLRLCPYAAPTLCPGLRKTALHRVRYSDGLCPLGALAAYPMLSYAPKANTRKRNFSTICTSKAGMLEPGDTGDGQRGGEAVESRGQSR